MKRHPALHTLSYDHHQGLILAQQLKKGAPQYKGMPLTLDGKKEYTLSFYKADLAKHFRDEEEILFPAVKSKNAKLDKLVAEIISEHRKMEKLVAEMKTSSQLENVLNEIGNLLESHIRKEERILFPEIEKRLSENELKHIGDKISR